MKNRRPETEFVATDCAADAPSAWPALRALALQTAAISWEIFERTKSYENLALVGLVQIIPVVGLFMPAGHLIDRVDRRKILVLALASTALWSAGLFYCSLTVAPLWCLYALLL